MYLIVVTEMKDESPCFLCERFHNILGYVSQYKNAIMEAEEIAQ